MFVSLKDVAIVAAKFGVCCLVLGAFWLAYVLVWAIFG